MNPSRPRRNAARALLLALGVLTAALPLAASADASVADAPSRALREAYEGKRRAGPGLPGLPIYVESRQTPDTLAGNVHSRMNQPFARVRAALERPQRWCEILMLHPNVKGCAVEAGDEALTLWLGSAETPARFGYRIAQSSDEYLDVRLTAASGPFGTSDYVIRIEAVPLAPDATLLHLAYSHGYGARAKLALQAYFSTFGRDKVGFTVLRQNAAGQPVYVGDLRGGIERNAMRYYLAIEAHLEAAGTVPAQRLTQSLATWIERIQRHPLQLGEEPGFPERKRAEILRYQSAPTGHSG